MSDNAQNTLPRVTVLLAAYNGEKWIEQQIRSILDQQSVAITLVISIDASTDATQALVSRITENEPNITLLTVGQRFGDAAKNFYRLIQDCSAMQADYIAFADQDDIWLPEKLSRAIQKMRLERAHAYSSNVLAFWEDGTKQLISKDQPQKKYDYLFESAGPGCTYVLSSSAYAQFRQFILQNWLSVQQVEFHDWLAYAYCRAAGLPWTIDAQYGMLYRQHSANQIGANKGFKAAISRFKRFREGQYKNQIQRISQLLQPLLPGDPIVKSILDDTRASRMVLIRHYCELRRKRSHQLILLSMFLFGFF
jgi:rhamnosyltransferase